MNERDRLEGDRDELKDELRWRREAMEKVKGICLQDQAQKTTTNPLQILITLELSEPGDWS